MPPKKDDELDDELDEDLDDEDLDDDEDDEDDDKTEDELRAELKQIRKSLSKANGSSAKRRTSSRTRIRELEAQLAAARTTPKPKAKADDVDEPVDVEAVKAAAIAEAKAEAAKTRKADKAEVALGRAGVVPAKLSKAARLLDLDDLELDDDGTLDGIDEQISELKKDWPELFATKRRPRQSVAGENDRDGADKGGGKPKSASEKQAAQLLGRGRD